MNSDFFEKEKIKKRYFVISTNFFGKFLTKT